jgi:hypothetical protein
MPTDRELLESLRDGFEQLELFDRARLNSLRDRGQMIIGRVFGPDSPYIERLTSIEFSYRGVVTIGTLGGGDSPATKRARERAWQSGQEQSIALVDIMLEDLELGKPEPVQASEEPTGPRSNRVFVVHGHDGEMKQAVARTIERLGLEAVLMSPVMPPPLGQVPPLSEHWHQIKRSPPPILANPAQDSESRPIVPQFTEDDDGGDLSDDRNCNAHPEQQEHSASLPEYAGQSRAGYLANLLHGVEGSEATSLARRVLGRDVGYS